MRQLPTARVTRHIRLYHQRLLVKALSVNPGSSQADLIESSGLSRPTVGAILYSLLADGYVVRDRSERPRRGAPVGHYFLNAERIRFLGIDISPAGAFGQWIDVHGRRLKTVEWEQGELLAPAQAIERASDDPTAGGAIAVPAMFDPASQRLERSTVVPELVASRLRERFIAAHKAPFHYVHNAAAAALAEQSVSHEPFVVFMLVGTSIGAGYADHAGPAGLGPHHGEIAHLPIDPRGPTCVVCGRKGCLESWAGLGAIARALGLGPAEEGSDRAMLSVVRGRLEQLGGRWPASLHGTLEALATAAEILTQVVGELPLVLGGPIGEPLVARVRDRIAERPEWLKPRLRAPLFLAAEGSTRVAYGAALAARDHWLDTFPGESAPEQEKL